MRDFLPLESILGGIFIGAACGVYMLLAGRVAGNSGALKALILGPREPTKLTFLAGLASGGRLMGTLLPSAFEVAPAATPTLALAGLAVGLGTALGNGCTSGHGLCGISRFSLRSLVAVPTFMGVAIATATARSGTSIGVIAPIGTSSPAVLALALKLGAALLATVLPMRMISDEALRDACVGLWTGVCFAVGLSIGGMVRPSAVTGALSPARFDGTLWALFMTALLTTFVLYRVAQAIGRKEASVSSASGSAPQGIDTCLLVGSALFGLGWGLGGVCPGPHVVNLGASPTDAGPLLMLACVAIGQILAQPVRNALTQGAALPQVSSVAEVQAALKHPGAVIVDLRPVSPKEAVAGVNGVRFRGVVGAVSAVWDAATGTMPTGALPSDKATPLLLYCRSGGRAAQAVAFLRSQGHTSVLNVGGPVASHELFAALERPMYAHDLGIFAQLFDGADGGGSSTYTYILGDPVTKEAIIIDPVLEQVDRDLAVLDQLDLTLRYALNTHCHADHITGTGALKKRRPAVTSMISKASGAKADRLLAPGEHITWAEGRRSLTTLATPGHTNGCVSYSDAQIGCVFTGDALLIDGCGRTDFQEGSAATLYESVQGQLFSLPSETLVLPAHDYKGRAYSTVGAQKATNPRFAKGKEGFVEIMRNLSLPHPKKIDVAVPANLACGI